MKILGMDMNLKMFLYIFGLNGLIVIDIFLISIALLFDISESAAMTIQLFDLTVCIILLIEWFTTLFLSDARKTFLKDRDNILALIASIPFDMILPAIFPGMGLLKYLRLLKLIRILFLFERIFYRFKIFVRKTRLDKILGAVLLVVVIFTFLLYFFGPSYGIFDDFYFVIVTLTTVGYGDITPQTYNEKVISLILITIGLFIFSTITAAISSYLTENLIREDEEDLLDEKLKTLNDKMDNLSEENRMLREEIRELKESLEDE